MRGKYVRKTADQVVVNTTEGETKSPATQNGKMDTSMLDTPDQCCETNIDHRQQA